MADPADAVATAQSLKQALEQIEKTHLFVRGSGTDTEAVVARALEIVDGEPMRGLLWFPTLDLLDGDQKRAWFPDDGVHWCTIRVDAADWGVNKQGELAGLQTGGKPDDDKIRRSFLKKKTT